jgi:hypothetical protein
MQEPGIIEPDFGLELDRPDGHASLAVAGADGPRERNRNVGARSQAPKS